MIIPKIAKIEERKIIGVCLTTTQVDNDTSILWSKFMPRHKEISNRIGTHFYSLQKYPLNLDAKKFTPKTKFERWAAVEVSSFDSVPNEMQKTLIEAGTYAVFVHKGTVAQFAKTFNYIYTTWLPNSIYEIDDRAHFEFLGDTYYGPNNPESEEEIWLPIKKKA
ncbi:GyrI-like domain-containing protein [Leeuwenhoekiella aequorea]|uniref:AraC family transcriptional regulator n=1 Tax=Leeuwenhoekiella aequorea TaxID=283736 RepID=A0A4V1KQB0_9FLAO|nr:GyrI-like domain-containing protein [Leeuwenhoekiella aequorea]RXG20782.1 AraC family transcriptional regulator [Leeuwenhoekiella aequorea]